MASCRRISTAAAALPGSIPALAILARVFASLRRIFLLRIAGRCASIFGRALMIIAEMMITVTAMTAAVSFGTAAR